MSGRYVRPLCQTAKSDVARECFSSQLDDEGFKGRWKHVFVGRPPIRKPTLSDPALDRLAIFASDFLMISSTALASASQQWPALDAYGASATQTPWGSNAKGSILLC